MHGIIEEGESNILWHPLSISLNLHQSFSAFCDEQQLSNNLFGIALVHESLSHAGPYSSMFVVCAAWMITRQYVCSDGVIVFVYVQKERFPCENN